MITTNVTDARNWDYRDHLACKNCGRNRNLARVFIGDDRKLPIELCLCANCWKELFGKVEFQLGNQLTNS